LKDIAIVICNFNKEEYLRQAIQSIANATFQEYSKDIIVVDNASIDRSIEMIKQEFPEVILIQTGSNLGGAGGFAAGMQYALVHGYSYVSILDNDTKVAPDVFTRLVGELKKDSHLGIAGATILQMDNPQMIQEMGACIDYENYILKLNYVNANITDETLPDELECDYVPACCFMARVDILQKVGVFNKDYFIYFDDVEWSTRVKNADYHIKAFKNIHVWHKGGAKLLTNTFAQYYSYRNMIRFFLKNIKEERLDHFISSFTQRIQKAVFFSNLKNEFTSTKSILLAIDDAYASKLGPRFDAIFSKGNAQNSFYELCAEKQNILILNHADPLGMNKILYNLQAVSNAHITVCKYPFEKEQEFFTYDLVCHSVNHILDFSNYDSSADIFIDPYGNYLLNQTDKERLNEYDRYAAFFEQILQPTLEYKFLKIFQEFH